MPYSWETPLQTTGSGKTLTIAGKVKYLCQEKGIPPEEILLIAFTKNDVGNAFWRCMGWTKREDLNYYDFTLNEANITAFNS